MAKPTHLNRRHLLAAGLSAGLAASAPSWAWATDSVADAPFPDTVDLRPLFPPIKDQGARNTCAFFAATALVEALQTRLTGVVTPLSEQFLAYVTKTQVTETIGEEASLFDAMMMAQKYGVCPESYWPYNSVSWLASGQRCAEYGSVDKDSKYYHVARRDTPISCFAQERPPQAAFEKAASIASQISPKVTDQVMFPPAKWERDKTDDRRAKLLVRRLARGGNPVVLTVKFAASTQGWGASGVLSLPEELVGRDDLDEDESPIGNHFIVICGYDLNRRVFMFRNSWGESWGDRGYGMLSFDLLATPIVMSQAIHLPMPKSSDDRTQMIAT